MTKSSPMRAVKPTAEQESHYTLNSPLLFGVLKGLDPESRVDILDLAPANPELLDYFAPFHCKLLLPGCRDALLKLSKPDDADDSYLPRIFNTLLPFPNDCNKTLDLVLLWDLPNYLDKQVLSALITHIMPGLDRHSILHIYIHTRQSMPDYPAEYRFHCENNIQLNMTTAWNTPSPMYYQELLHKILTPFRVDRGMLLANGLQEYILRIK